MKVTFHAIALSVFTALATVAEPAVAVRTAIKAAEETWVGQQVILKVELVAPGYFASAPVFDLPHVPGVLIFPPVGSPTLGSETIDDTACTVQYHELMVFSQKPGSVSIPPFEIRFSTKTSALAKDSVPQSVKTQAVSFSAKQPPGSQPGEPIITSADLSLTESWKPEPKDGKPGDAFVRTLTWEASDVPGMAFPPPPADAIAGLGIYQGDPVVNDHSERGTSQGQRVDTVTYVCKTGGSFTIPAHTVRWWDPQKKEIKSVDFPARAFHVTPPPVPPVPPGEQLIAFYRLHKPGFFMTLLGSVGVIVFIRLTLPFWKRFYRQFFPKHLSPLNPS